MSSTTSVNNYFIVQCMGSNDVSSYCLIKFNLLFSSYAYHRSNHYLKLPRLSLLMQKSSSSVSATPRDTKKHIKTTATANRILSHNKDNAHVIPTSKLNNNTRATITKAQAADDGSNRTATTDEKSSISSSTSDIINNVSVESSSTTTAPTPSAPSPVSSILWSGKKSFADVLKKQQQLDAQVGFKN